MPYNSDGSKIKNPTKSQHAAYMRQKAATKHSQNPHARLYAGSNAGGASIGGGSAAS